MHPQSTIDRFWTKVDKHGPVPAHCPDLGPCWLWTGSCQYQGYGQFSFDGRLQMAHRVAWQLAHGPTELAVLHRCDNPPCVRDSHLFTGTQLDNMRDKIAKGRAGDSRPKHPASGDRNGAYTHPEALPRGDEHWARRSPELLKRGDESWSRTHPDRVARGDRCRNSKLSADAVLAIRRRFAAGESLDSLASDFNVTKQAIWAIKERKVWKHI